MTDEPAKGPLALRLHALASLPQEYQDQVWRQHDQMILAVLRGAQSVCTTIVCQGLPVSDPAVPLKAVGRLLEQLFDWAAAEAANLPNASRDQFIKTATAAWDRYALANARPAPGQRPT